LNEGAVYAIGSAKAVCRTQGPLFQIL
jgi:hypothetical protein